MKPGKSRKRALVLVTLGMTAVAAAGGFYAFRRWQIDRQALASRDAGKAALEAGDNEAALDGIGTYIKRFGEAKATSEDYALYAKARQAVPMPNDEHVLGAISALQRASQLDPTAQTVQDDLLALYLRAKHHAEAALLVQTMLDSTPGDLRLLRTQADVLEAMRKFPEAVTAAKALAARPDAGPQDLFRILRLIVRGESLMRDVEAWLDATVAGRKDDPLSDQFRGVAQFMRDNPSHARELVERVVVESLSADDHGLRTILFRALDGTGRFAETFALVRSMPDARDPELRREIVRRLWCAGDAKTALARTESWDPDVRSADPEMLALRAFALASLGRGPEAASLRAELAARPDPAAKAWSSLVELARPDGPVPAHIAAATMTEAVAAVPGSALLHMALGDAKAGCGELDAAVRAWTDASARAPSWSHPLARLSRAYRSLHRPKLALEAARGAVARSPNSLDAMGAWIDASADAADSMEPPERAAFVSRLAAIRTAMPELTDTILPVCVALIAPTDKAAALAVIDEALDSSTRASEDALLRVAGAASNAGIQAAERVLARCEELHGVTPRLAVTAAILRHRASPSRGGLATFDAHRSRSPDGGAGAEWDVARASLLDALGSSEAAAAWAALADANPSTVAVQLAALSSPSIWMDRDAALRTIERVRSLTGDAGVAWRVSRARFLLETPEVPERDATEASEILAGALRDAPDNAFAHLLLARARRRLGDPAGAEEHVQAASKLAPENGWIALELAQMAQARGETAGARAQVDQMLSSASLVPRQAQGAAYLLAAQGDLVRSAELLQRLVKDSQADRGGALVLSGLYAKLGRTDEAIRLSEQLLGEPTAQIIEHTAGLYAAAGRTADAERLLARLDKLQLAAGEAELVRARYASRWGPPGAAIARFRAAIDAAPDRAASWAALLAYAITTGDAAAVAAVLDDPRATRLDAVQYLRSIRDLCTFAMADPGLRLLLVAVIGEPPSRPAVEAALRAITRDWPDPARRVETAKNVRTLAEANSKVLVLQLIAVDLCAQTADHRTAVEFAWRTAAAFPTCAHAARQWAQLLASGGDVTNALAAGREWRSRAEREDADADEFVARMLVRLGRTTEAAKALEPRVAAALERPDANESILVTHAVVLLRTGKADQSARLLRSLAERSDRWRALPLSVGPDMLGGGPAALAWLKTCNELASKGDANQRLRLARAWAVSARAFRTPELLAGAKAILGEILTSPDAPAGAHALAGSVAEASGDLAAARAAYEAALAVNPDLNAVRNNLAMVLADSGRWEDAVAQATRVTTATPGNAEALDTLAYALRKGRRFDEATSRLREAIQADPSNPAWQVSLAETRAEAGDPAGRTAALEQLRKMESDGAVIAPLLRTRIDKLAAKRE